MKGFVLFAALAIITTSAIADTPYLIDRQTGKYLGNLSSNKYDPDSVSNEYGRYGSKYSPESINNKYGQYGSRYSPDSANNPYASNPPAIMHDSAHSGLGGLPGLPRLRGLGD